MYTWNKVNGSDTTRRPLLVFNVSNFLQKDLFILDQSAESLYYTKNLEKISPAIGSRIKPVSLLMKSHKQ